MLSDYKHNKLEQFLKKIKEDRDLAELDAIGRHYSEQEKSFFRGQLSAFQSCYEQLKAILEE